MLNSERSNKLIKFSIIIHGSNSRKYLSTVLAIRRNILEILIFKKREHAIFLHSFIRYVAVYTFMHKRFPEKFNPWKMNKNYKISDLYINLTCLSVCLYPINVKICVGPHVAPGKVYKCSKFFIICLQQNSIFIKF